MADTVKRILTPAEATSIQTALNEHNAHLTVDGHFGEISHLALLRFQHDNGLPETGNPDLATTEALGIPPITTPAPLKPKLTPNPVVQAIGRLALDLILQRLTKGAISMSFLTGYKTFIIGGLLIVIGAIELLGWQVPGVPLDPGQGIPTIMAGIGLITGRVGAKTEAAKVSGN
jgi:hypothetical protein